MLGTEKYVFGGLGSESVNEEFPVMNEELLQDLHLSSYDSSIGSAGTMCLDELSCERSVCCQSTQYFQKLYRGFYFIRSKICLF